MNQRTKAGERVFGTPREKPAAFRNKGGKSEPKAAGISALAGFCGSYFCGGEIVEYVHGRGFKAEKWRNVTGSVLITGDRLLITSEKRFWSHDDIGKLQVREEGGIFYLSGPDFPDLALAPMGVKIPEETMQDALEDSAMLLHEGMGGKREPPMTEKERLCRTCFAGGTIVELLVAEGMELECNRRTIAETRMDGNKLTILAEGGTAVSIPDIGHELIETVGGIFLIYGNHPHYALAPKGVLIPERPNLVEIEDAKEVLAGDKE
ncbi:MAG: hypothetical protein PHQ80_04295 [Candidatus ainarchaeum sp.]|nr:hypothetical protein [Candidatus ainarchaeum sp.]